MALTVTLVLMLAVQTVAKLIDLSHLHGPQTFMASGMNHYNHTITFSGDFQPGVFIEMGTIFSGEHGGTHIDAPNHFDKEGKYLHEIPLEYTVLSGVMIDCSSDVNGNATYVMPLQKLHDWEKEHGQIPKGAAIVINFGWSSRFGDPSQYVGSHDLSNMLTFSYPSLSDEAGDWLVKERDARLLAVDVMSPDLAKDNFPVHIAFLTNDRLIVENVKDAGRLPPKGFRLHAAPVKFLGSSGAQIRLYAMTFDEDPGGNGGCSLSLSVSLTSLTILLASFWFL